MKTAVTWLIDQLEAEGVDLSKHPLTIRAAKEMEQKQFELALNIPLEDRVEYLLSKINEE